MKISRQKCLNLDRTKFNTITMRSSSNYARKKQSICCGMFGFLIGLGFVLYPDRNMMIFGILIFILSFASCLPAFATSSIEEQRYPKKRNNIRNQNVNENINENQIHVHVYNPPTPNPPYTPTAAQPYAPMAGQQYPSNYGSTQPQQNQAEYCSICGVQVHPNMQFCPNCGNKL